MPDKIEYKESKDAVIDYSDLNVKITTVAQKAPKVKKYHRISVLATKKNGGSQQSGGSSSSGSTGSSSSSSSVNSGSSNDDLKGVEVTAENLDANKGKIKEADELKLYPGTKVSLWNISDPKAEDMKKIVDYGSTLLVLSDAVSTFKDKVSGLASSIPETFIIWYTETSANQNNGEVQKLALSPNRGVFVDTEKKGKLVYTLTRFLANPEKYPFINTMSVASDVFEKCITSETDAEKLDEAGISYYFKTTNWTYPRGFWLGNHQARKVYGDLSVIHDTKETIGDMITQGLEYNEDTPNHILSNLMIMLQKNPYVKKLIDVSVPPQKASNRVKGIIENIMVKYQGVNEVRTVKVTMESKN